MSATAIAPDMIAGPDTTAIESTSSQADPSGPESDALQSPEIQIQLPSGDIRTYMQAAELGQDIVGGRIPEESHARVIPDPGSPDAAEPAWVSIPDLAIHHPELRSAYRPVWDAALRFMGYGALAGVALKLLDSTLLMFAIDQGLGVFWLMVIGSLLLSSRWPLAPLVVVFFSIKAGIGGGLFFGALIAGLIGYAFGAPLGLIVGTLVGHFRRDRSETAPDAPPEGSRPYMLGLAAPVMYLGLAVPAYVWFNIKAFEWLAS